jgi:DNA-binding GntR family transcriptional regulator
MNYSPAMNRAKAFLDGHIEQCRARNELRLPVCPQLAAMAGVAPATMLKAVRELQRAGVLLVSQGKGTRIRGDTPVRAPDAIAVPLTIANRLQERILDDIDRGYFLPGENAPTLKAMMARYGVAFATLRKALAQFEQQQMLERRGKQFCGLAQSRGERLSVLLIAASDRDGHIEEMTPRTISFAHAIS